MLATNLDAEAATVFRLYCDRWPVEQVPLVAKQLLGLQRHFVFAPASTWRLPEVALLMGNILTVMATMLPPMPSGYGDRHPKKRPDACGVPWNKQLFQIPTPFRREFGKKHRERTTYQRESRPIVSDLLGLGAENVTLWQMALRSVIIYIAAIALVRIGEKRFLGKYTALDVILGFMLGSVLSRAVTGNTPYFETILGAALGLVLMHWLFAVLSFRSDRFGNLVKGGERVLVSNGDIQWDAMQSSHISENV